MAPIRGLLLARSLVSPRIATRLIVSTARFFSSGSRALKESERLQKKKASPKYIEKVKQAEEEWEERAAMIKRGELQNTWDLLVERGFVKDVAGLVLPLTLYIVYIFS